MNSGVGDEFGTGLICAVQSPSSFEIRTCASGLVSPGRWSTPTADGSPDDVGDEVAEAVLDESGRAADARP
jgi:hypothetical protein